MVDTRRDLVTSMSTPRPSFFCIADSTTSRMNMALVGRRVMATFLDESGTSQWYPAVIVKYLPNARIYK